MSGKMKEELNKMQKAVEADSEDSGKLTAEELDNIPGGFGECGRRAVINRDQCVECGTCIGYCPLGAIGPDFSIGPECDGCGVCEAACPVQCIQII